FLSFILSSSNLYLDLHSFPTRRSSDLRSNCIVRCKSPCNLRNFLFLQLTCCRFMNNVKPDRDVVRDYDIYKKTYKKLTVDAYVIDRKSTRLNSSHLVISYAVFCLKKKK